MVDVLQIDDSTQVQLDASVLVIETVETVEQLIVSDDSVNVVEVPAVNVLVTNESTVELLEQPQTQDVVTIGIQGPPGPPGQPGQQLVTVVADGILSGHRAVVMTGSQTVGYADHTNLAHANSVVGITTGAAIDGDDIDVQTAGEMIEPGWNWTLNQPVFLSTNGLLTQTCPTSGFTLILGVPIASNKLVIGIKQPFILES